MTSYGKAQKVLNIRRNPKVALMIETGDAYGELRGVMVRGHCEIIDEPGAVAAAFEARKQDQSHRPVQAGAIDWVDLRGWCRELSLEGELAEAEKVLGR